MKRILCLVLTVLMICTAFVMTGCEAQTLKLGLGVTANLAAGKDADGETNGSGELVTTAVAVLLDESGKILKLDIDVAQIKTGWTSAGEIVETTDLRTKYELGTDYGMSAYGAKHDGSDGAVLEWFEQADAFAATVTGKTLDEAKALMGDDGYATGDLAAAGCTVHVADFITTLEKAVANAAESNATEKDTLNVALVSNTSSSKSSSEEADGVAQVTTTIVAAAVNEKGEVTAAKTDCVDGKMTFDTNGVATGEAGNVKTKLELGTDYNMAAYGTKHDGSEGAVLEWFEQAAAFDAALVGKTVNDFAALADAEGYGAGELATAGCTIGVTDMIQAASKAAK